MSTLPEPSRVPYALCLEALCRNEFGCIIRKNRCCIDWLGWTTIFHFLAISVGVRLEVGFGFFSVGVAFGLVAL